MKEVIEINKRKKKELKMEFEDGQEKRKRKEENGEEEQFKEFQPEKYEREWNKSKSRIVINKINVCFP